MTSDTGFSALVWMNEAIGASKKDNNESVLHLAASDDVSLPFIFHFNVVSDIT